LGKTTSCLASARGFETAGPGTQAERSRTVWRRIPHHCNAHAGDVHTQSGTACSLRNGVRV